MDETKKNIEENLIKICNSLQAEIQKNIQNMEFKLIEHNIKVELSEKSQEYQEDVIRILKEIFENEKETARDLTYSDIYFAFDKIFELLEII